jgi:hypothetical protein
MSVIARAYESEQQAKEAINALLAKGLTEDRIQMIRPVSEQSTVSDGLRAGKALAQHNNTESYAQALENGQTIVIAEAHFGQGMVLSNAMDACNPVPLEKTADVEQAYDSSTPFSYMLGMPVLSRNNPAPFSAMFGFSTESSGLSFLSRWFGGTRSNSAAPLSNMIRMPLLTKSGGPILSKFGLKELKEDTHRTSSFGIPLLTGQAAPFSSVLEMDCKSDEPAPLSKKFGLKLLTTERDRTPAPPSNPNS